MSDKGEVTQKQFAWLTAKAPSAIAIIRCHLPSTGVLFNNAHLPNRIGQCRFLTIHNRVGALVDEVVVIRRSEAVLDCHCHSGPGIRAALSQCFVDHGYQEVKDFARGNDLSECDEWNRLSQLVHPASLPLVLHGNELPKAVEKFQDREPLILLTGPANAGKSTLLNTWCGHQRALVSDRAGTTRDLLTALTEHKGWRFHLVDSAGLRDTHDEIEQAGQSLVQRMRKKADIVLYLANDETGLTEEREQADFVIQGKADLRFPLDERGADQLYWSAPGFSDESELLLECLGDAICRRLGLPIA